MGVRLRNARSRCRDSDVSSAGYERGGRLGTASPAALDRTIRRRAFTSLSRIRDRRDLRFRGLGRGQSGPPRHLSQHSAAGAARRAVGARSVGTREVLERRRRSSLPRQGRAAPPSARRQSRRRTSAWGRFGWCRAVRGLAAADYERRRRALHRRSGRATSRARRRSTLARPRRQIRSSRIRLSPNLDSKTTAATRR